MCVYIYIYIYMYGHIKKVALRDIAKIKKSQIFVLFKK